MAVAAEAGPWGHSRGGSQLVSRTPSHGPLRRSSPGSTARAPRRLAAGDRRHNGAGSAVLAVLDGHHANLGQRRLVGRSRHRRLSRRRPGGGARRRSRRDSRRRQRHAHRRQRQPEHSQHVRDRGRLRVRAHERRRRAAGVGYRGRAAHRALAGHERQDRRHRVLPRARHRRFRRQRHPADRLPVPRWIDGRLHRPPGRLHRRRHDRGSGDAGHEPQRPASGGRKRSVARPGALDHR